MNNWMTRMDISVGWLGEEGAVLLAATILSHRETANRIPVLANLDLI